MKKQEKSMEQKQKEINEIEKIVKEAEIKYKVKKYE